MAARFGYVPVVPPFAGAGQNESIIAPYADVLMAMGGERWDEEAIGGDAPLLYLVATGGTEQAVMRLREKRQATSPHEPVFLLAHPGNNSLPASLEVLARLQQDGTRGRIFYLAGPYDEDGFAAVERAVADLAVARTLRASRVGLLGEPSDWLVASMPDSATVHDVWGPEVVPIPLTEVTERMADLDEGEVADAIASLTAGAVEIVEPTERELADVGRIYVALRGVVDAYALDAVTVRCFDLLLECKATGCFGLAELTDTGVIAGCEGDLVSTIGLLWAQLLTGETPWMANPAQVDEGENALWVAHCTVPRTIVEKYRLRSHFESGIGVGIQGELPPGPVTLVRLGGRGLDQLWLAEGEITKSGDAEDLCRTQAFVRLRSGHVSELLRHPLGNHLVVVRGHHADRLQTWFDSML